MTRISDILPGHHQQCDALFVAAEESAHNGDWPAAAAAFESFYQQMQAHFEAEEDILFPAFEAATGMSAGPTRVMTMEHQQMKALLEQLRAACGARDGEGFAGIAETLLVLMQQHNMKEENILYPMCDQALSAEAEGLGSRIKAELGLPDD
jgi:iron-sulfur cluster repair protein YtfE (RIC family)